MAGRLASPRQRTESEPKLVADRLIDVTRPYTKRLKVAPARRFAASNTPMNFNAKREMLFLTE